MKKFIYKAWSKILTAFGDIKIFRFPMFLVFDPDDFQVSGEKTLEIMEVLEPGDIICRGFNRYLDGKFIPDPLKFSHGAVYVGEDKIIHAVAEGVSETNVVEFTRCDRIAIFRPKRGQKTAIAKAKKFLKDSVPYDFGFTRDVSALYCYELCAECYPKLDIRTKTVSKLFGLIRKEDVYIAESFFESPDLECVFQYNPKFNIDFRK